MLDLKVTAIERHKLFLQRVISSKFVWGLKSSEGWCVSESNESERQVMPFWSDRAYEHQCAKAEWNQYAATSIPLSEFLDSWLPGMAGENVLVGTNWNVHLTGMELEPSLLRQQLIELSEKP